MKPFLPFLIMAFGFALFTFAGSDAISNTNTLSGQTVVKDSMPGCSKEKKCCVRRKRCQEKAAMQDSAKAAGCEKKSSGCCRSKKTAKCCKSKS